MFGVVPEEYWIMKLLTVVTVYVTFGDTGSVLLETSCMSSVKFPTFWKASAPKERREKKQS